MAPLKVIGAGTGTLSLMVALDMLGFGPCYHMNRISREHIRKFLNAADGMEIDWDELFKDFNSCVDWPTVAFYKELMIKYPHAKVILTVRDSPEKWYESARSTIFNVPLTTVANLAIWLRFGSNFPKMIIKIVLEGTFNWHFKDKERSIAVYNQHIEEVKRVVPEERLLIFNVKEGWVPLCKFLDVPVPKEAFPRVNDRDAFRARIRRAEVGMFLIILTSLYTLYCFYCYFI
ncbi:uncharacterized protein VTP21DRAFT_7035 [Calcarisporiella thermophila]|uniref:uncharacterized protein n=1 Tax=Calcarisporiella thermophila TaxID=911321 RepID=UPI0037432446